MSDNPFDDLDDDRDDDPFEALAEDSPDDGQSDADSAEAWDTDETSLFNDAVDPGDTSGTPDTGSEAPKTDDDPFTELDAGTPDAADTGPLDTGESDPFEGFERPDSDPFEDFDGGESGLDDTVWDDLSVDSEADSLSEQREGEKVSEVSKHRFCEQCPHFTGPPEIRCTHDGTEILEFLDMETIRIVDCPIVEEREEMGDVQ